MRVPAEDDDSVHATSGIILLGFHSTLQPGGQPLIVVVVRQHSDPAEHVVIRQSVVNPSQSRQRFTSPSRLSLGTGGLMRTTWITPAIVGATLLMVSHVGAQTDFQWRGRLAAGQTIELKGINGDIRATASSSGDVEVTAARIRTAQQPGRRPNRGRPTFGRRHDLRGVSNRSRPRTQQLRARPRRPLEHAGQRHRGALRRARALRRRLHRAHGERRNQRRVAARRRGSLLGQRVGAAHDHRSRGRESRSTVP